MVTGQFLQLSRCTRGCTIHRTFVGCITVGMSSTPQHIVRADLVIVGVDLIKGHAAMNQFTRNVGGDFQQVSAGVDIAIPGGTGISSRTLSFPQERIALQLSAARSVVLREYPPLNSLEDDLNRLADVAATAIDCTVDEDKAGLVSYGYNVQAVFTQTDCGLAMEYLAKTMLNQQAVSSGDRVLVGGMAAAILRDGPIHWTFRAEPWPNGDRNADRVSLSVNRHTDAPTGFPDRTNVAQALMEVWDEAISFMGNLDQGIQ